MNESTLQNLIDKAAERRLFNDVYGPHTLGLFADLPLRNIKAWIDAVSEKSGETTLDEPLSRFVGGRIGMDGLDHVIINHHTPGYIAEETQRFFEEVYRPYIPGGATRDFIRNNQTTNL